MEAEGVALLTPVSRREIFAWAMYDWANSAYSTLSITILNGYLLKVVFPQDRWGHTGDVTWAWGIGSSMFVAGLLSPIFGAWADAQANKRGCLTVTALGGAMAIIGLTLVPVNQPWVITALFILAAFCFELSLVFYNGFMPELADGQSMNRISSWGFGLGYIGGGMSLVVAMILYNSGPLIALPEPADRLRAGLVLLGVWWAVFSLPAIFVLRDRAVPRHDASSWLSTAKSSLREVRYTLSHIRNLPMLALFLLGFLFYNDSVQSVISQSSTFATRELDFTTGELAQVILMIQFVAFPGAIIIGWIADRWGAMRALHLCLVAWTLVLVAAYFVTTKASFWGLGAAVALVLGGVQSVSRAVMGTLTPPSRAAEFFGFFNLSGKATSFLGTFLFGLVIMLTGSARLAIVSLSLLLVIGWVILARVDIDRGRRETLEAES